jgi:hypothetical protein
LPSDGAGAKSTHPRATSGEPGRNPVASEVVGVVGSVVGVVVTTVEVVVVVDDREIRFEIVTIAATITANQITWMRRRRSSLKRRALSSRFRFAARFWR